MEHLSIAHYVDDVEEILQMIEIEISSIGCNDGNIKCSVEYNKVCCVVILP